MPTNTLTDHLCKSAKPSEKDRKMFDGHGLYLFVSAKGAKVWRMAYRVDGKPKTKSLTTAAELGVDVLYVLSGQRSVPVESRLPRRPSGAACSAGSRPSNSPSRSASPCWRLRHP